MQSASRLLLALGLALCPRTYAQSGSCPISGDTLAEIRLLRLELLESRIDVQSQKVLPLEQALAQIKSERIRLRDQEQANATQLAQVDARLAASNLAAEERAQLDAIRTAIAGQQLDEIRAAQTAIDKLEAETSGRLRTEQQRLEALQLRRNSMAAAQ